MTNGTRRGWGVSVTLRPLFTPGKDPVPIVQEAGWAPGPVWTGAENLAPIGIRCRDRPARSQSLYRLSYPAHWKSSKYYIFWPVPMAARSKAYVCGRSLAKIVGSNPTGGHGCLSVVSVVCCQKSRPRADHSSREVLPTMVCRCVCSRNLVSEKALAHWGAVAPKINKQRRFQKLYRKKKSFHVRHSAFDHDKHYVRKQVWIIKYGMLKYHKKNCYLHTGEQILFSIFLLRVYITTITLRFATQSCRNSNICLSRFYLHLLSADSVVY